MSEPKTIKGPWGKERFSVDSGSMFDLSIPLRFNGPQPNAYGVEPAGSKACEYGELVGDTRRGGSCNFESYTLIPHCIGTHTECVGHVTHERISIRDCLKDAFIPSQLISVSPTAADGEQIITRLALEAALPSPSELPDDFALIIRTLPNDDGKLVRKYGEAVPPYFDPDATEFIVEAGCKHLLVDLPSIDRLHDGGKLANHRIFWNVEQGSFAVNAEARKNSTITELIYVANEAPDGKYLLNLQIAPFATDASPSRPLIFPICS